MTDGSTALINRPKSRIFLSVAQLLIAAVLLPGSARNTNNFAAVGAAYSGIPASFPGTAQAENCDLGGEGVGYHDLDMANGGGAYPTSEAVALQATSDSGGGVNIGWVRAEDWMNYVVQASPAGAYSSNVYDSRTHQAMLAIFSTIPARDAYHWSSLGTVDTSGTSSPAATATPTPAPLRTAETRVPSAPTGLSASVVSSSQINLSWSASADSGLDANTSYSYAPAAYDAMENSSAKSGSVSTAMQAAAGGRIAQTWTDRRMIMQWLWGSELGGPVNDSDVAGGAPALIDFANGAIQLAQQNNAQGVILWDPEGYQSGGSGVNVFTYVGDPRLLPQLNPTVNGTIDQVASMVKAAGLRFGICIRAQYANITTRTNDSYPNEITAINDMIAKTQYAVDRWDATLFYVDSNNRNNYDDIVALHDAFPNALFIPEHTFDAPGGDSTSLEVPFLSVSAPLTYVWNLAGTINLLPGGFAAIYLSPNTTASDIQANMPAIVRAVEAGSIIGPVVGWYPSEQLSTVAAIKQQAGVE
jgi:hypothetical protein